MANEECGYPSVKCKKRVTVLVEGGEIELFDGEVSASPLRSPLRPLRSSLSLRRMCAEHWFRTRVNGILCSHEGAYEVELYYLTSYFTRGTN